MTRELAIKVIKRMIKTGIAYDDGYAFEPLTQDEEKACGMAIKALEVVAENTTTEPIGNSDKLDCISRTDAIVTIKNLYPDMPVMDIMGARRKWQEKYSQYIECEKEIERLPSVQPKAEQEPCEDCISRKDIYFKLTNGAYSNETIEQFIDRLVKELEALPPVNPQETKTDIEEKIHKMKTEIADALEFWNYSPNNNPLARDMLETITNFWGEVEQ